MFNLGITEMILIAVIALIFIGPKQLPGIAQSVGKMLNELKRAGEDLTGQFINARDNVDREIRKTAEEISVKVDLEQKPVPEPAHHQASTTKSESIKHDLKNTLKDINKKG